MPGQEQTCFCPLVLVDGFLNTSYEVLVLVASVSCVVCHSRQASWILEAGHQGGRTLFASQIRNFCAKEFEHHRSRGQKGLLSRRNLVRT